MGTVTKRSTASGVVRYRAQVRVQRTDYPEFKQSRTFSKKSLAEEWIRRLEAEIELNPDKVLSTKKTLATKSLGELIIQYLDEADSFARTKGGALKFIASLDIAKKDINTLTRQDFSEHAIQRRKGDPAIGMDGVSPSTVLKELSHIKAVLVHAEYVWGYSSIENILIEYEKALLGLKKSRIVTRSKQRDRLPTAEELQILTNHFYKAWRRVKNATPMHLIIWFAIYSGRREDEICSLQLSDFDEINSQWLVRDAKNPKGSLGNHKFAHLEPMALEMVNEFLKSDVRSRMASLGYDPNLLIPVNAKTVSTYFTRACDICGIEDLRFHDLRHEAATRYAENGLTIPQLQTITLHESWNTLKRYVNLKKRGARLEFNDAIHVAEENYNTFYKSWTKKQRYIAEIDRNDAFDQDSEVHADFKPLQKMIESFIAAHKDSKFFKRLHIKKLGSSNPFAWNNDLNRFYADDIQLSWEDWLVEQRPHIDWDQLPEGATHISVKNLDIVKQMKVRTYVWDNAIQGWVDSFGRYSVNDKHLAK